MNSQRRVNIFKVKPLHLILIFTFLIILPSNVAASSISVSNVENKTPMATSAWVNWTVDDTANNTVEFSMNADLSGSSWSAWSNGTSSPQMKLWNLQPNTKYYYSVWSYNSSDNSDYTNSSIHNFTTGSTTATIDVSASDTSQTGVDNVIQEAIDNLPYSGGTVNVSAEQFDLSPVKYHLPKYLTDQNDNESSAITIYNKSLTFKGEGMQDTILNLTSLGSVIYVYKSNGVTLRDFNSIHDAELNYGVSNGNNIQVYNSTDMLIENINATYAGWSPFLIRGSDKTYEPDTYTYNITVKDCIANGGTSSILTKLHVYNLTLENCTVPDFDLNQRPMYGIRFDGVTPPSDKYNYIKNCSVHQFVGNRGIEAYSASHRTIITGCNSTGDDAAYNLNLVSECTIENSIAHGANVDGGIMLTIKNSDKHNNTIKGNLIYDSIRGIYFRDYSTEGDNYFFRDCLIESNTIYNNNGDGILLTSRFYNFTADNLTIKNNIIANNTGYGINNPDNETINVNYNNIWNNDAGKLNNTDCNNYIEQNPLFTSPTIPYDFHLKSTEGTWNTTTESWDTYEVYSPCIDTGDPNADYSNEPQPNGSRINLGAYGNTYETSKSPIGNIEGTVKDTNGQPIENAKIRTGTFSVLSNNNGEYNLTLPIGTYSITAIKSGYQNQTHEDVSVSKGEVKSLNFSLTPNSPQLMSCDKNGDEKNVFTDNETIYLKCVGLTAGDSITAYIVENTTWFDGDSILSYLKMVNLTADEDGEVFSPIWANPSEGYYDIFVDVNKNNVYDASIDVVDDVSSSPGVTAVVTSTQIVTNDLTYGDIQANNLNYYYTTTEGGIDKVTDNTQADNIHHFASIDLPSNSGSLKVDLGSNMILPDTAKLFIDDDSTPNSDPTDDKNQIQVTSSNGNATTTYSGRNGNNTLNYTSDGYVYVFLNTGSATEGDIKVDITLSSPS